MDQQIRTIILQILDPIQARISTMITDITRLDSEIQQQHAISQDLINMASTQKSQQNIIFSNISELQQELRLSKESSIQQNVKNQSILQQSQNLLDELNNNQKKTQTQLQQHSQNIEQLECNHTFLEKQLTNNFIQMNKKSAQQHEELKQVTTNNKTQIEQLTVFYQQMIKEQLEIKSISTEFSDSMAIMQSLKEQKEIINKQFLELVEISMNKEQIQELLDQQKNFFQTELKQANTKFNQFATQTQNEYKSLKDEIGQIIIDKNQIEQTISTTLVEYKKLQEQLQVQSYKVEKDLEQFVENEKLLEQNWNNHFDQMLNAFNNQKEEVQIIKLNVKKALNKFNDKFQQVVDENDSKIQQYFNNSKSEFKQIFNLKFEELAESQKDFSQFILEKQTMSEQLLQSTAKLMDKEEKQPETISQEQFDLLNTQMDTKINNLQAQLDKQQQLILKQKERLEFFIVQTKSYLKKYLDKDVTNDDSMNVKFTLSKCITRELDQIPILDQPKQEQHRQDQPKQDHIKQEQPKQDHSKQEQPKHDQPKQDQRKDQQQYENEMSTQKYSDQYEIIQDINQLRLQLTDFTTAQQFFQQTITSQFEKLKSMVIKLKGDYYNDIHYLSQQVECFSRFKDGQNIIATDLRKTIYQSQDILQLLLIITLHNELVKANKKDQVKLKLKSTYEYIPFEQDSSTYIHYDHLKQQISSLLIRFIERINNTEVETKRVEPASTKKFKPLDQSNLILKTQTSDSTRVSLKQQITVGFSQKITRRRCKTTHNQESIKGLLDIKGLNKQK